MKARARSSSETVTLYEDATGTILANSQASHGYLYVTVYLKEDSWFVDRTAEHEGVTFQIIGYSGPRPRPALSRKARARNDEEHGVHADSHHA